MKPLMLLDVDGVLNPFQRRSADWVIHKAMFRGETVVVALNPAFGPKLLALAEKFDAELVWATSWTFDANREIGARIGLPELPYIDVHGPAPEPPAISPNLLAQVCWKTPAIANYVDGRPFVWFDDDLSRADSQYLKEHEGVGQFRIVSTGQRRGLEDKHLRQAEKWLMTL